MTETSNKTISIYCVNTGRYIDVPGGATLAEIYADMADEIGFKPICARVNNKTEHLGYAVYKPKQVEYLDAVTPTGQRVYLRSLCMLLYRAVYGRMPGVTLRIEHSVCAGYYCRLLRDGVPVGVTDTLLDDLKRDMAALAERDLPYERRERRTADVVEIFRSQNLDAKVRLLEGMHRLYTTYYTLDGIADSYYGPLAPSTGSISVFDLHPYKEGFLLMSLDPANPGMPRTKVMQEKMFGVFERYLDFNRIIGVSDVAELNRAVQEKRGPEVINVAEAMHFNYIARMADAIAARHAEGKARIVLIAGPSSSGKTTFCKRLGIQLTTNLLKPKMISLDDYFVDREHTPLDETGDYDYESLYALDLERLNSDLQALLRGETINLPSYSFELGRRVDKERPLSLRRDEILIIEGIHGLNPELTASLPADKLYKIYVSALTTMRIDSHNWISTTDNRLLRRIVRDNRYRATSAYETIRRWPSVRRGEEKWIFPYQENADATFNSSLIFELGVMKPFAEPQLLDVPHDVPEYSVAYRLLQMLAYFNPIPLDHIPSTSLLREFLGGSSFKY